MSRIHFHMILGCCWSIYSVWSMLKWTVHVIYIRGSHWSENGRGKKKFNIREKSGDFILNEKKNWHFEEKSVKMKIIKHGWKKNLGSLISTIFFIVEKRKSILSFSYQSYWVKRMAVYCKFHNKKKCTMLLFT